MRTKRGRSVVLAAVVAAGLALVVSACGGGGGGGGGGTGTGATTGPAAQKTFPELKVVWGTTDYMDPGLSYRLESWQLFQGVYLGLLGKAYVTCSPTSNCTKIIPVIAQSLPTVNSAGTDFKFTLRKGLHYSNGALVKPSDFKSTIIRDFQGNSPGIGFYNNIVGVDACSANPTKCRDISGIIPNDSANTLEIKLKQPQSDFEYVLTLPFSALVPAGTPKPPVDNPPPPANGPYYIKTYNANKSFLVERNPHYKKGSIPTIPQGNPDKVVGTMTPDVTASAQMVVNGTVDYDENLLPTDRLSSLQNKYKTRIHFWRTPSTYYWFLNQGMAPFNNLKAREAVNWAINRQTLVNLRGGLGVPTQNFLPPTYPQYRKINPFPNSGSPAALAKAKRLVRESGTAGDKVSVYTISDVTFDKKAGEYLNSVLQSIGYKTTLHEIASANYFVVIGNQSTKASIGFTDWFEDYPYPTDWFRVLLYGPTITKTHNNNPGLVDIPEMNSRINQLTHLAPADALSSSTDAKWATVDNLFMTKYAATAPYLNGVLTSFFSSRIDPACDINDDWESDVFQFCLR